MPKKKETKRSEEDEEINDEERSGIDNNGEVCIKVGDIMTTNVIGAKPRRFNRTYCKINVCL